jgi:flagellar motility protein MotE (MotC chaperone)
MNACRNLAIALGAIFLFQDMAGAAGTGPGKTYRWTDKNGVVHIGDNVPPEYASQGQAELNAQGVPVRETRRQLSPAEDAAARQAEAELAKRRQRDSSLLATYTRVSDIEKLRDERLALIDGQMDIVRGSMSTNNQRLAGLRDRMRNFQPYSSAPNPRRLPDQLAEEAVLALKEQRSLEEILAAREAEKNELRAKSDSDIARYRELTARPASR